MDLFIKVYNYDVKLVTWPKGTFVTKGYVSFTTKEICIRCGHVELEACKQCP